MKKFILVMMAFILAFGNVLPSATVLADDEGITLDFTQVPGTRANSQEFLTGELMQSIVRFKANLSDPEFEGAYLSLTYSEEVDAYLESVDANIDFANSDVFSYQQKIGNETRIYFKESTSGDAKEAEFPVFAKYKTYRTPDGTVLPITLSLKKADGTIAKAAGTNTFIGVVNPPTHWMEVIGGSDQVGGISSNNQTLDSNGLIDVVFEYSTDAKHDFDSWSEYKEQFGQRIYSSITLTQPLPPHAVFDQAKNPNWMYDAPTNTATYTLDRKDYDDPYGYNPVRLRLTFPGASLDTRYTAESTMLYHPTNKPAYEGEPTSQASAFYTFLQDAGKGNPFTKTFDYVSGEDSTGKGEPRVTNTSNRLKKGLDWYLVVANGQNETAKFTSFKDYGLDDRLYYTGVSLPRTDDDAWTGGLNSGIYKKLSNVTVKAIMVDGSEQVMGTVSSGRRLNFSDASVAKNIKELHFEFPDGTVVNHNEVVQFNIHTNLREAAILLPTDLENTYHNSGSYSAIYTRQNGTSYPFIGEDTAAFVLQESKPDIGLAKSLSEKLGTGWFAKKRTEPLRSDDEHAIWEIGQHWGEDAIKGLKSTDVIESLQLIDILPEGLTYVSTSAYGGKSEYIENYNNSGLNAVVITYSNITVSRFNRLMDENEPQIVTKVNSNSLPGHNVNTLLIKVNDQFLTTKDAHHMPWGETYTDNRDLDGDGDTTETFAAATAYYEYIGRYELIARKYIAKDYRDNYTQDGIRTAPSEAFKYKLFNYNNKLTPVTSYELIDLLPYVNDATSAQDAVTNTYKPRESKFSNTLTGPVQFISKNANKFTVYYTTDALTETVENPRDTLSWLTEVADYSKVTGLRIVLNDGQQFNKAETLEVVVPMKAPSSAAALDRGWNDFIIATDGKQFTPTNRVYNEIDAPSGIVKIIKVEKGTNQPLANVVFKVFNKDGQPVLDRDGEQLTVTTDKNGEGEIELTVGGYQLKEVVPKGYLDEDKFIPVTVVANEVTPVTVENTKAFGSVKVIKVDADDETKTLAGATFALKQNGETIETKDTDRSGTILFENVPYGEYQIVETFAPVGYIRSGSVPVTVDSSAEPVEIKVTNRKNEVRVEKIDAEDPALVIEGATFTITDMTTGEVVAEAVTNADGLAAFKGLPAGTYRVQETKAAPGYAIDAYAYEDFVLDSNDEELDISITNRKALRIKVKKEWLAQKNSKAPVTVLLKFKGEVIAEKTIDPSEKDFILFDNLKRIDEDGSELAEFYTIEEKDAVDGKLRINGKEFNSVIADVTDTIKNPEEFTTYYKITNSENVNFTARKVWVNGPEAKPTVTFVLQQNGADYAGADATKELPNGTTEVTWTNLPATDAQGNAYTYSVKELPVANYVTTYNDAKDEVTNTYAPGETSFTARKVWVNGPEAKPTVTFVLQQNGADYAGADATKELPNGTTEVTWENLPATDAQGNVYVYSVKELAVENYVTTYNDAKDTVTNTYVTPAPETKSVTVDKVWVDDNNKDGKRPSEITVHLLANGEVVDTVVLTEATGWKHTFENLAVQANDKPIVYTVSEDKVDGYTTRIDGFTITNTRDEVPPTPVPNKPKGKLPNTGEVRSLLAIIILVIIGLVFGIKRKLN